jgi:hypothetical protein
MVEEDKCDEQEKKFHMVFYCVVPEFIRKASKYNFKASIVKRVFNI